MVSTEKVINYKIVDHIEIYNFASDLFFIWDSMYNSRKLNFKIRELQTELWDRKWFQMKKVINYKVVDLIDLYKLDKKFVFTRLCLKNLWIL